MPDDSPDLDLEIIRAAYAEKLKEIFKLFAESVAMGQNEKLCRERFTRSLDMTRRARDMALALATGVDLDARPESAEPETVAPQPLSEEDQALIEQAIAQTTGTKPRFPLRRG